MGKVVFVSLVTAALAFGQAPSVFEGGVVNAASFASGQAVTPGSLVSIFGSELAGVLASADSIPLATQLASVSVRFNNTSAPLLAVIPQGPSNPAQVNAQLLWNVASGAATVVVTRDGVNSQPRQFQVGPFSPGLFSFPPGEGQAIAINFPDPTLAAPRGSIPGLETRPARIGDVVQILATGLGALDIPLADGHNSIDQLRRTITLPEVLVGGVPVTVEFSGMSPQFVGVNQVNVRIDNPNVPRGDRIPLQIRVGGILSTDKVTIAVE